MQGYTGKTTTEDTEGVGGQHLASFEETDSGSQRGLMVRGDIRFERQAEDLAGIDPRCGLQA